MTEGRGTGIPKMLRAIERNQSPLPEFYTDEDRTYFRVEFPIHPVFMEKTRIDASVDQAETQDGTKMAPSWHQVEILRKCLKECRLVDLMAVTGRSDRTKFRKQLLNPLLDAGWITMTIPDKPTSRLQRYRLTEKGREQLERIDWV